MITDRPLALGYIRETVLTSDTDVAAARRALVEFAEREGYSLGTVYVEGVERTPVAFQALVASVIREEALAVAVPGPHPVAMIGAASSLRRRCAVSGGLDDARSSLLDRPVGPDASVRTRGKHAG